MPKKRRVKVYKWERIKGKLRSKKVEDGHALFHQWGLDSHEAGNYSTAIIERDDGTIENVPVYLIKFINPKDENNG